MNAVVLAVALGAAGLFAGVGAQDSNAPRYRFDADNYLGGRVLVFALDTLAFKRGWGAYGHKLADISLDPADHEWVGSTPPKEFQSHLTVNVSPDGLVHAADRMADRVHVTTREGKFVKELLFSPPGTKRGETGSRGVAGSVTFSADKEQKYLYASDMKNNTIWFVNRAVITVLPRRDSCSSRSSSMRHAFT